MTKTKTKKKPAKRAKKDTPDEDLTPEQLYQRKYYEKRKAERSKKHKKRWEEDEDYRSREVERQRRKRQEVRESAVNERFAGRVCKKRDAAKPTRRPKYVEIDGVRCYVYGTGSMAREVGREDATIRAWLASGVLPGASIWIGRRAHFTKEFITAVRAACKRMLAEDGRGNNKRFGELVCEELIDAEISYEAKR